MLGQHRKGEGRRGPLQRECLPGAEARRGTAKAHISRKTGVSMPFIILIFIISEQACFRFTMLVEADSFPSSVLSVLNAKINVHLRSHSL